MLKGHKIDLTIVEKSDLPIVKEWFNDVDFVGEFEPFQQQSLSELEKQYDSKSETNSFFIIKKMVPKSGT